MPQMVTSMGYSRRAVLVGLGSAGFVAAVPSRVMAAFEAEYFAATRKDAFGNFSAALFDSNGTDLREVVLPARGHDIAVRPGTREWVAFARRPGCFAVAVPGDDTPPIWFTTRADRHFFGHGVFSRDGRLLYTTENDFERGRGMIGVRDAAAGYKQIGEFPSHGIGPHDLALLSDGQTLVVANGGIRTHPDRKREPLNLGEMMPSLAYVDVETGGLIEAHRLAPDLHQLSIRHLAIGDGDVVVFGCQYRGSHEDLPPLMGFHARGEELAVVPAPLPIRKVLHNYIGSVTTDASGTIAAASAPKGGVVTYWDVSARRYIGSNPLRDGCGVAPTHRPAAFLLTSGEGLLVPARAGHHEDPKRTPYRWDNHAILVR